MKSTSYILLVLLLLSGCSNTNDDGLPVFHSPGSVPYLKQGKQFQVSSHDTTGGNNDRINIHAGEAATIFDREGPGIITRIWFTIDSPDPDFLRQIVLRMYWDNEETPSVEVPIGDFFGCGYEYRHYTSHFLGMSGGGYYCYFPMPFNTSARIEVVNETGREVYAFYYHINYFKLDNPFKKNTAYFHAFWKRDIRTDYDSNYTVLYAEGEGHFIGMNLHVQPYNSSFVYLEGDEMIFVDEESTPSLYGTGTEDYFTSGWYYKKGEYAASYHGLILKDTATGRTVAYRHHIPDPIPFNKSILFTIEHGHANREIADYSSTAYWYQREPHKPFPPLLKASLRKPLKATLPNGMTEAEDLYESVTTPAEIKIMDMSDYGPEWSNLKQLLITGNCGETVQFKIDDLPESVYTTDLFYTLHPEYGKADIFHNDIYLGEIDSGSEEICAGGRIRMKKLRCEDNSLTLSLILKNSNNGRVKLGIDGLKLYPVRNYIPEWQIIGPFPNKRDSDILRYGIDSVYPPEKEIDFKASYTGAEKQTVRWRKISTPNHGYISLWDKVNPYELVVTYAVTYIYSPVAQHVELLAGSDDGIKIFLNGKEVHRFLDVRIAAPDQDLIPVDLKKGWNTLLFKIENNFGGYAFYARIRGSGYPLEYRAERPVL